MATRPKGDFTQPLPGFVPKDEHEAAPAPPSAATPTTAVGSKAYAHTLSLRLSAEQYRQLRSHARKLEDEQGGRVTHQGIIEAALAEYLAKRA